MDPASQSDLFFLFIALPFCLMTALASVLLVYWKKEKIFYLGTILSVTLGLICIFAALKQVLPTLITIGFGVLLIAVGWPRLSRAMERVYVKDMYEVDLSAPLRVRDYFTWKAWLVMASRWGVWKTLLLLQLFSLAIGIVPLFLASLLGFISMREFMIYMIIASIFSTIFLYRQFIKVF